MKVSLSSSAWNRLKIVFLTLGVVSLSACQAVPTPDKLPRTLTVSGKGDVNIPATMTKVNLGVQVQGKTTQEVQQQVAEKSSAVVALLKSRKEVEKLETTGISLNPVYSYKDGQQKIEGYSGTNNVSFRIETQKAGTLLDDAVKVGATQINGISLVASESAIAQAQKEAIKEAAEDARKQADALLAALNLNQREIVSIQINDANPPLPLQRAIATENAQVSASKLADTPIVGGEQEVQAAVTLQIRY